jgi:hypothetical protein
MPYEATLIIEISAQTDYALVKRCISQATEKFKMGPDAWSIQVSSEPHASWGFVYYTHPSPAFLDRIIEFWLTKIPDMSCERVHRITQAQFFEALAAKMRSGEAAIGIVNELALLSGKGVTTTGMIEWVAELHDDIGAVLQELRTVRQSPYSPERPIESYP